MLAKPDCIPCMFNQALKTARAATDDEAAHRQVLQELADQLNTEFGDLTPAAAVMPVYEIVSRVTGVADPFADHKRESNRLALELLPSLRERVASATNPLDAALHLAAAGNVIDVGISAVSDLQRDVANMLDTRFAVSDLAAFDSQLHPGCKLLYIGDNAGEIVFDTVLVDLLRARGVAVTYAVKSGPILNDATMEDALCCDMAARATVIETGSADIGVNFTRSSPLFLDTFARADIVLAKGQGNFETCNQRPENIFCLLKAKCELVAAELAVELGDVAFKHYPLTAT